MKQNKEVIVLVEQKDSIKLVLEKTLFFKEMDKINFKSSAFSKIIIRDTYVVSESKIFYLYEKKPHDRGIMDMEQLQELPDTPGVEQKDHQTKKYSSGPYEMNGSDQFSIMYSLGVKSLYFKLRIYQLPDSTDIFLTQNKQVKLATFLDKETILVQIAKRYLMFDQNGGFIDEINFTD